MSETIGLLQSRSEGPKPLADLVIQYDQLPQELNGADQSLKAQIHFPTQS